MAEKIKGRVFDIRRFSTNDGDGIRTTIFLKGCYLKCAWCQNPEGINPQKGLIYFENKCIKCKTCVHLCQNGSVVSENDGIKIIMEKCEESENKKLVDNCPSGALAMDCKEYTVDEVVNLALKDKEFFKYNGGITLSGGEPFFQKDFSIALLKEFKKLKINIAIETSLYVDDKILSEASQYLDRIFADLKIYDNEKHKKYTNVSNEIIKSNIKMLLESDKKDRVIIRTPLIPGITTVEENIYNIGRYISGIYPEVKYEILNYNPLAKAKYKYIDNMQYCFDENPRMYTKDEMKEFYKIAYKSGIKNLIV